MGETIPIAGRDGRFDAYLSRPATTPSAAVIVIQEIFGVNRWLRGIADSLAADGFLAVAPDLFWRFEPGLQLDADVPAEFDRALSMYMQYQEDDGVADLKATVEAVRQLPDCNGKVGTMGFCLGGKLAYLMACRSDTDCNLSYYGVGIEKNLGEADAIKRPLAMHFAREDRFVPREAQDAVEKRFAGSGLVTVYSYAGVDHAFGRPGNHYNAEAAELAEGRTRAFLRAHLG